MMEIGAEKLPAYACWPDGEPKAAVCITFEVWGLTDFIKDVTWRLTNENQYLALAPDWLHGLPGAAPQERVPALTDEIFAKRVETVLSFLESEGIKKIGVTGFCMGGRLAMLAAAVGKDRIQAAAPFYGALIDSPGPGNTPAFRGPMAKLADISSSVLLTVGENEELATKDDISRLESKMKELGKPFEIVWYPDAGHAFFNHTRPEKYRPEAAEPAWEKVSAFFQTHLTH